MMFTSYAQNFEDVMLWRALKHIEHGCYVDVGAQHPVIDSVSKAFYERGWRGIHIEPVPEYADLLRKDRPDETVLQVALADTEGTLELNVIVDTGLSTAVEAYAQAHQVERGLAHQRIQVPVMTLKSALTSLIGKNVHWLKIDVEGLEEKVLKGWDSQILRPWVMVVEATIPCSPETDYGSWDPILTAADYQFVYFDGLNRFYVAKEHAELAEAFSCPPNVFDGVRLSGLASSELCLGLIATHQASEKALSAQAQRLAVELGVAKARISELDRLSRHWWTVADGPNRELQSIYASKLWPITWSLRWILRMSKRLFQPLIIWVMRQILSHPGLKARTLSVLAEYPRIYQRLREFTARSGLSENTVTIASAPKVSKESIGNLSPLATRIYADLKKTIVVRQS